MHNNIFSTIISTISILWTVISLIGYVLYKNREEINSWEDGVKRIMTIGFNWFYEEATRQNEEKNLLNTSLMLTNTEVLELVKNFDKHPYETPTIYSYNPNSYGVAWYDIHALGLSPAYTGLSNEQIKQMAEFVIQNYFMYTRNTQIPIYILATSPTRLFFAIPLSENGQLFLEKQRQPAATHNCSSICLSSSKGLNPSMNTDSSIDSDSLEEEINLFED